MVKEIFILVLAAVACATLSKQMWWSANKVAKKKEARDQVFKAVQKVCPSIQTGQKEKVVNRFEKGVRMGAIVAGGASIVFAICAAFKFFSS